MAPNIDEVAAILAQSLYYNPNIKTEQELNHPEYTSLYKKPIALKMHKPTIHLLR